MKTLKRRILLAQERAGIEDLQPGEDLLVRFGSGPKGLVVAEVQLA